MHAHPNAAFSFLRSNSSESFNARIVAAREQSILDNVIFWHDWFGERLATLQLHYMTESERSGRSAVLDATDEDGELEELVAKAAVTYNAAAEKGTHIVTKVKVANFADRTFIIESSSTKGVQYSVTLPSDDGARPTCQCNAMFHSGVPCSHIHAAAAKYADLGGVPYNEKQWVDRRLTKRAARDLFVRDFSASIIGNVALTEVNLVHPPSKRGRGRPAKKRQRSAAGR